MVPCQILSSYAMLSLIILSKNTWLSNTVHNILFVFNHPTWNHSFVKDCFMFYMFLYWFIRPQPQRLGAYRFGVSVRPSVRPSVRLSVIDSFTGCIFLTNGRRDLGIGSYERSWPVDVPFDSFGQIRPPEMAEFGQNVQNSGFRNLSFSRLFLCNGWS